MNLRFLLSIITFLLSASFLKAQISFVEQASPLGGKTVNSYTARSGIEFKIGDTISVAPIIDNKTFFKTFDFSKKGALDVESIGKTNAKIQSFKINGNKKLGYTVWIELIKEGTQNSHWMFFENDAVAERRIAEHMLEIELISQEEFDNLKRN